MTDNPFERLWALGYKTLVPIIPPGAPISVQSSLYKRVGTHQDGRGKVPGVKGSDGNWFSFNWLPHETDEDDLRRWAAMGAGVGIRTGPLGDGTTLVGGDADAPEEAHALIIRDVFRKHLGSMMPIRVGRLPKALYLFRVRGDYTYRRLDFGPRDDKGNILYRVEMLSQGQQFVAHGVHPKTMQPYTWPKPLIAVHDLPIFEPEQVDAALQEMASLLPQAAPKLSKAGGDGDVNQEALRGDLEAVRRAVAATPNTTAAFPTREAYRDFGYAIKAALPDHPDEAFDIYASWCDRWQDEHGRTNDPDIYEADWRRMKPPFRIGAGYVFEKAERLSGGAFTRGEVWFDTVPEADRAETIFDLAAGTEGKSEVAVPPLVARRVSMEDMEFLPPREWLYGTKLLRKYVAFFASPGGVGKTAYMIALMLACAANKQLLHEQPRAGRPLNVWMINLEDDIVEMRRRLKAAVMHFGLGEDVLANVRLNSGRDRGVKIVKQGDGGAFIVTPDYQLLVDEMRREQIDLLIVDPFLRSHGVPENDNGAQDEVMRLFAQIAQETDAAVALVHHTKKGAIAGDMDSMRGASTQSGGARSAYTLAPMSAEDAKRFGIPEEERRLYVRIDDAKSNMAPPLAKVEWLRLIGVPLMNGNDVYSAGDNVQVATAWSLPDAWEGVGEHEVELLAAIDAGTPDGERYSIRAQDKSRWAGDLLVERAGRSPEQAKVILAAWEKEGRIETRDYASPGQRRNRKGLYVNQRPAQDIFG